MLTYPDRQETGRAAYHVLWIFEQAVGIDGLAFLLWKSASTPPDAAVAFLALCQGLFLLYFFRVSAPALERNLGSFRYELPPVGPALWLASTGPWVITLLTLIALTGGRR